MTGWGDFGAWWLSELASDPAYHEQIEPLAIEFAAPAGRILDVGCGEGRLMRSLLRRGCQVVGADLNHQLLVEAARVAPVVMTELPSLAAFRNDVFDGALMSLVLEHVRDHIELLRELSRVVRPGGWLVMVSNHPFFTAPESAPIDEADGEVLWRSGSYLESGFSDEQIGDRTVRFYHRPMGGLLTDAAEQGWSLQRLDEYGVTDSQVADSPPLGKQRHIPRLFRVRWTLG